MGDVTGAIVDDMIMMQNGGDFTLYTKNTMISRCYMGETQGDRYFKSYGSYDHQIGSLIEEGDVKLFEEMLDKWRNMDTVDQICVFHTKSSCEIWKYMGGN